MQRSAGSAWNRMRTAAVLAATVAGAAVVGGVAGGDRELRGAAPAGQPKERPLTKTPLEKVDPRVPYDISSKAYAIPNDPKSGLGTEELLAKKAPTTPATPEQTRSVRDLVTKVEVAYQEGDHEKLSGLLVEGNVRAIDAGIENFATLRRLAAVMQTKYGKASPAAALDPKTALQRLRKMALEGDVGVTPEGRLVFKLKVTRARGAGEEVVTTEGGAAVKVGEKLLLEMDAYSGDRATQALAANKRIKDVTDKLIGEINDGKHKTYGDADTAFREMMKAAGDAASAGAAKTAKPGVPTYRPSEILPRLRAKTGTPKPDAAPKPDAPAVKK